MYVHVNLYTSLTLHLIWHEHALELLRYEGGSVRDVKVSYHQHEFTEISP